MEVSSIAMLAEAVKVVHSQIQALHAAQHTENTSSVPLHTMSFI